MSILVLKYQTRSYRYISNTSNVEQIVLGLEHFNNFLGGLGGRGENMTIYFKSKLPSNI